MAGCHLRERARSETLCAALEGALRCYPQQHNGMVALSLRWAANGWAERRSRGTSRFIDVQGAAAAKELRQNHPNLILTFGPELLAAGHDSAPAEGAGHRGLARQLAYNSAM